MPGNPCVKNSLVFISIIAACPPEAGKPQSFFERKIPDTDRSKASHGASGNDKHGVLLKNLSISHKEQISASSLNYYPF
jgi:hypothetical protein